MRTFDWDDIVERLNKQLRLMQQPVGMKWIRTEEELNAIAKVRIHKARFAPCAVLGQAIQFGWTVACKSENIHADYCRGIHGMFERDEKWFSGEMFNNVWFDNIEASKAHNAAVECAPPEYVALVASPLTAGRIEPDVCVLYTSSAQAFMLFAGWQHHAYEKLQFTFVGESGCSDSWIHTFVTGKPGFSIPSFAERKFGGAGEWEVRVTFQPADLLRAVEGIECMYKAGLRYPIAPYSLTTDMIAGLPPHYMEY